MFVYTKKRCVAPLGLGAFGGIRYPGFTLGAIELSPLRGWVYLPVRVFKNGKIYVSQKLEVKLCFAGY